MSDETKKRANYLTVAQQYNLEQACKVLGPVFGWRTYLVGSVLDRPTWRDVDLRCILADNDFDLLIGEIVYAGKREPNRHRLLFLNTVISEWLSARTELPVDFQLQRQTDANLAFAGQRNFVGRPQQVDEVVGACFIAGREGGER